MLAPSTTTAGAFIACGAAAALSATKTIKTVDLYRLGDGSLVKSFASEKGSSALLWLTFSPDGNSLAAADWNGSITLWNAGTVERKKTIAGSHAGVHCAVFSPDGTTLAIGSEDKTLRVVNIATELIGP
jgi:WD40 repeat protein